MAANKFKPGDKVICIKDHPDYHFDGKYAVKKDTVLTVRIGTTKTRNGKWAIGFEELRPPQREDGSEIGYDAADFAPYNPPRERIVYVAETLREEVTYEKKRVAQHN